MFNVHLHRSLLSSMWITSMCLILFPAHDDNSSNYAALRLVLYDAHKNMNKPNGRNILNTRSINTHETRTLSSPTIGVFTMKKKEINNANGKKISRIPQKKTIIRKICETAGTLPTPKLHFPFLPYFQF
eukprot:TRINITY_DN556_c0_g1_i3.p1 TRINITY_DN556_c0_g1~~TRINITY_DN556_c0_g1_i3.p1  ORF type:complete len:129 (-),score=10.53 TRINITY_DN556_c0_g1_i3:276-662(-)